MRIAIAGTGYVGLVTGVCLAEKGHNVVCVDTDENKIAWLNLGRSPVFEEGVEELIAKNRDRLTFTTDYRAAYKNSEVTIIAVGTPEKKDGSANLSYVFQAAIQIAKSIERDTVIVIKSTVPIGTGDKIAKIVNDNLCHRVNAEVTANPEFLSQGTAVKNTLNASRIVVGVESEEAERVLREVYRGFDQEMILTDRKSAEMIKYASNDFLALKISYINEIANLCELVDANINDVAYGMGLDPRIGGSFLQAGIGYGGSCFPKDTKALHWLANFHDYEIKTIKAAIEVNENQKLKLIKKSQKYYDSFYGLNVAVLGLTFKPNTDDLRDAPSLQNIPILLDDGAHVKAFDPIGEPNYRKVFPTEVEYCESIEETITDADICFIFTEWGVIKQFDVSKFAQLMKNPIVLDGRNCYDLNQMKGQGVVYESIGRRTIVGKAAHAEFLHPGKLVRGSVVYTHKRAMEV
ncbi:UDP-glucose 6-dehydrogenase [Acididesulfobacillus acetoxydans]|uniref:UDP-glucose 6-dehydrogenase n=1 Tax=Acididesulfobacillus acetoxydans TaxID=1561005 RepID=A0A8S0WR88_9FIRM|nr:UDP-glucose/GDP-mannose dehydrogenase family protein [Acididesulfobacillus acetoxydans]CAA7603144.1 UDP-glucose 6-dehydrogenase [Acididesulfobacillus acetoxydans]CEJ07628.1 UDP-glucose 6-dehydrogenase YwqF [Acididesulfobacillus acetoxydans]